ncbi:MAG TPA: AMP-binding protein [Kineosporiaceae bacterium]|nr:AMP-binding protein [Kineosporiaceae bacterium]
MRDTGARLPGEQSRGPSVDTADHLSAAVNTADHLLAAGRDDDIVLVDGARRYTYRELRAAAARIAGELAGAGLPPGSRVGLLGPNSLFWVAGYLAVMKLGHVVVPLTDKLFPQALATRLEVAGLAAACVDRRSGRRFAQVLGGLPVLTDACLSADGPVYWPPPQEQDLDADAALMFTSGTTATPRAVRTTHRNIQASTAGITAYLGLTDADRMLVVLPFHYCYGASLLHTHLRVGARLVLCNSFVYPEKAVDLLEREECTGLAGVPSTFMMLLRLGSFTSRPLPALRQLQQAGGKLAEPLIQELVAAKPHAQVFVMYGQTEGTSRLSYLPPQLLAGKPGSIGRGMPGVELAVLDERGEPVPPGVRGEIYARGDTISPGYFRDPEGTAEKFTPRGLRTGDIGLVDEDGYVSVVDRVGDFIKSWGNRVSSAEIEACALRHPELVAAAAVGVPDPLAGETVALFVEARPGSTLSGEQLLDSMARGLPTYMVPKQVVFVERMPLNANGKIVKAALRELAAEAGGPADR